MVVTSFLSAIFLFAAASVSLPGDVLGATVSKVTLCSTNLRTSASTSARVRTVIGTATKVSVATSVTGGSWRTTCAGKTVSGTTWYRISAVNEKSVKSLYGVRYLYAATSLFKAVVPTPTTAVPASLGPKPAGATMWVDARGLARIWYYKNGAARPTVSGTGSFTFQAWSGPNVTLTWSPGPASTLRYTAVFRKALSGVHKGTYIRVTDAGTTWHHLATSTTAPAPTPTATPEPAVAAEVLPSPTPTPTATPTASPSPTPSPFADMTEGIDVSHWQGTIAWTMVAAAGKRFAYMKASEGTTYVDPTYGWNRQQARAAGLYVGAYHFGQPSTTAGDAVAQADHFIVTATPASGDLLPVLDLERTGSLSQVALTAWAQAYVERIYERIGVRAVIYVSPNFWRTYMGDTTWFAANGYDILWTAHWTAGTSPTVPGANWAGDGWTFWQYTSDGIVPGISTRVDLDRYRGADFTRVLIP